MYVLHHVCASGCEEEEPDLGSLEEGVLLTTEHP